ncbi:hypothetical protein FBU59_003323 [Linderina macrospora]|uniref:Uncharacterized protein n=1 Tax=Linderina macrospora TaxID=4868 RepID=A0ACC1J8U4_9FUNG|nr:hypothetical protein FBU59_003323 [Linderina macrospora]
MNATKWATLSEFVMYLGREGKCKVEETERGWFVQWIDNSPEALARKEAILKKERQEMDDEQLEHKLLKEQIRRARNAETPASKAEATELKRDSQQPIKLSLKPKLGVAKTSAFKKPSVSPFAALQNANNANNAVQTKSVGASARKPVSAVDAIMHQELLKKDATGLQRHHNDRTRLRQHSRSRSPDNASCQDSPAVRRRSRSPQQQRRHR